MGPSWLTGDLAFHLFFLGIFVFGFLWPRGLLVVLNYFQRRAFPEREVRLWRWLCFAGIVAIVPFILNDLAGNP